MKRLHLILWIGLISAAAGAQDWRFDKEDESYFNCALIASLKADFGAEPMLRFADGDTFTVDDFFDGSYPACAEMASDDAIGEADAAADQLENELEVIAVLEDHEEYTLFDAGCSVRVADRFEADLNLSLAGRRREQITVDVYLPGESEKIAMPHVRHEEINVYGIVTPMRIEWVEAPDFPTGAYLISVRINERTRHFRWDRRDDAYRTIILSCLPAESE